MPVVVTGGTTGPMNSRDPDVPVAVEGGHLFGSTVVRFAEEPRAEGKVTAAISAQERTTGAGIEFRILGPLEALEQGKPLALGGKRQRAVLALLLLDEGRVVSTDRLVDELWGEEPPRTATTSLQNLVSRLRKALGPGRARDEAARATSLRLNAPRSSTSRGSSSSSPRRASAGAGRAVPRLLREALALWRGPPLADFQYEPFAGGRSGRLEELRSRRSRICIDAELELGRAHRARRRARGARRRRIRCASACAAS